MGLGKKRIGMRRTLLWVGSLLLVALFAGGATFLAYQNYPGLFPAKDTVRIATGPLTESDEKVLDAFVREMAKESPRIQIVITRTAGLDASADALKSGKVDAALVRSDNPMVAEGRTLALMRRVGVLAILGGQSSARSWSDLAGKTVGVLSSSGQIDPLQKTVLDFYGITAERLRVVAPTDVGAQIADEQIAALLAIGPSGPGAMADAAHAIRLATGKPPKVLELDAADAISERYPAYEKVDVSQGALVALPPMPPKSATVLAVAVRLVSSRTLSNHSAGEITRVILATKARLAGSEIGAGGIEAPDTDKPVFPIHPGTLAHLEGEKPATLDDSLTYLAIGSIVLGALGSFGAWLGGFLTTRLQGKTRDRVAALPAYLAAIKTGSSDDLDRIESELDELSEWLMEHYVREEITSERYGTLQARIAEIRTVLARRRATTGKDQGVRLITRSR
jgi:TRAP-type uncharacterized transport system substrate-binding protein